MRAAPPDLDQSQVPPVPLLTRSRARVSRGGLFHVRDDRAGTGEAGAHGGEAT